MFKKLFTVIIAATMLTACAGENSKKIASLQKRDKTLTCSEIQLEINEAEYYRQSAEKKKAPGLSSLVMPVGYISTYMNAQDASESANERINYLNRIYDIRKCDDVEQAQARAGTTYRQNNHVGQQYAPADYAPVNPYITTSRLPAQAYYQPMSMQQQDPYQGDYYYNEPVPDYMIDGYW